MQTILKIFSMSIFIVLIFPSCKTTQKSSSSDYDYIKITKQGIVQKPLIADLEISKEKKSLTKVYENATLNYAKELVMGAFIQEFKCDLVVHPLFYSTTTTTSKNDIRSISITVSGYTGSYKNIRNFELKDTVNFFPRNIVIFNPAESVLSTSEVPVISKKKKGGLLGALVQ